MKRDVEALDWAAWAACKGNIELFFGPLNERPVARAVRETAAKRLCAACPVLAPCREFARQHHEQGLWGGETEDERRAASRGLAVSGAGPAGR